MHSFLFHSSSTVFFNYELLTWGHSDPRKHILLLGDKKGYDTLARCLLSASFTPPIIYISVLKTLACVMFMLLCALTPQK